MEEEIAGGNSSEVEQGRGWEGGSQSTAGAAEITHHHLHDKNQLNCGAVWYEEKAWNWLVSIQENRISVSVLLITCCITLTTLTSSGHGFLISTGI